MTFVFSLFRPFVIVFWLRLGSDVYSLGATLYALLTGRPPHQANHPALTLVKILEEVPIAPRKLQPAIQLDLETICLKCLEKNPVERYADADQLAGRLRLFRDNKPIPHSISSSRFEKSSLALLHSAGSECIFLFSIAGGSHERGPATVV